MTKCYVQKKDVFDINKVTVVGSPTITSDGVASGFTIDNYIVTAQTIDLSNANRWEILTPVFNINALTSLNGIMTTAVNKDGIIDIFIRTNGQVAWGVSDVFARRNPKANIKANINYQLGIEFTGTNYNLYLSTNGSAFNLIDTYASTQKTALNSTLITGMRLGSPLNGFIDLTQFSITVDNELIYSPTKPAYLLERRKEGFDRSKFTVVGSPSITEYGVYAGTNTTDNYVIVPIDNKLENYRIELPMHIGSVGNYAVSGLYQIYVYTNVANRLIFYVDDSRNLISIVWDPYGLKDVFNKDWVFAFEKQGNTYSAYYKLANETDFKLAGSKEVESIVTTNPFMLLQKCEGQVSLPSISITVDGKEVFTGAKEKFYAMRGGK